MKKEDKANQYGAAALWLSCGALGLVAATIILAGTEMQPTLTASRHDKSADPTPTRPEVE